MRAIRRLAAALALIFVARIAPKAVAPPRRGR